MRLFEGTEFDRPPRCEHCGELESDCQCPPPIAQPLPPAQQTAIVKLEKRSQGKTVTTIKGLDNTGDHLADLLTDLKNACGAGGTLASEVLEIQGDHVERLIQLLSRRGYRIKR